MDMPGGEIIVERGSRRHRTGRRRAGDGCVSSGRRRSLSGVAGADALRQICAEPVGAHGCRRAAPLTQRGRSLFRAPRLRRRLSGLPGTVQIGRPLYEISARGRGWLRHPRLVDAAELVQRPGRHLRPLLRGPYPGRARLSRPAGLGGAVSRLRRVFQRLSQRHPPWRRFRFETGDLGFQQRTGRRQGPRGQGGASGTGHQKVVRADAVAQGRFAAQRGPGIRGLPLRAMVARHVRRFLEAAGHLCGRLLRPLCRCAGRQPLGAGTIPMRGRRWRITSACRGGSVARFS